RFAYPQIRPGFTFGAAWRCPTFALRTRGAAPGPGRRRGRVAVAPRADPGRDHGDAQGRPAGRREDVMTSEQGKPGVERPMPSGHVGGRQNGRALGVSLGEVLEADHGTSTPHSPSEESEESPPRGPAGEGFFGPEGSEASEESSRTHTPGTDSLDPS